MSKELKITSLESLGPFLAVQNNAKNTVYLSDVPQVCKDEPCMLGVDEAGRGPVLGPLVYGIAYCPIVKAELLKDLGCADSKQLNEETRDKIFNALNTEEAPKTNIGWAIDVISPSYISSNMLKRTKYSLNEISMDSAIGLIQQAIDAGVNIAEVYVDTVGPPEKYQAKLQHIFPDFQIVVAKKADSTYPIVSAASICAKVSRDHAIKVWTFPEDIEIGEKGFGSGYPGDPVTKTFLRENIDNVFGFPRLVRFSWSTAVNLLDDKVAYNVTFDEDEDVEKTKKGTPITSFFNKTNGSEGKIVKERHRFFKTRCLEKVTEF